MIVGEAFCFWDSQTIFDAIIMSLDTCISAVLLGLVVKSYMKARIVLKEGVLKFYYLMMLWGCSSFLVSCRFYWEGCVWSCCVLCLLLASSGITTWARNVNHHHQKLKNISVSRCLARCVGTNSPPRDLSQHVLPYLQCRLANLIAYGLLKDRKVQFMYSAGRVYFWARLLILLPGVVLFGHF